MFYSDEDLLKLCAMDDLANEHFRSRVKNFYRIDKDFIFGFTKNSYDVEVNVLDDDRFYVFVVNKNTHYFQETYFDYKNMVRFLLHVDMLN